jgi:hypothetical protein
MNVHLVFDVLAGRLWQFRMLLLVFQVLFQADGQRLIWNFSTIRLPTCRPATLDVEHACREGRWHQLRYGSRGAGQSPCVVA